MIPANRVIFAGAPEGADALTLARLAAKGGDLLHIARDDARMARLADSLLFFSPEAEILEFPAWDCVPYDRVSPHVDIVARRVETLAKLAGRGAGARPRIILSTVAAVLQRLPPVEVSPRSRSRSRSGGRSTWLGCNSSCSGTATAVPTR